MVKIILICGITSIFLVHFVKSTVVNTCDNGALLPNTTMYAGTLLCNQTPCTCIPGCPFTIYLEFLSPKYLENMKPNILATYAGVTIPYPLNQDDACDGIENTQCPIVKNEHIKYKISMDILNIFPEVTVALEFTIKDQDTGDAVICVLFDIDVRKIDCPS